MKMTIWFTLAIVLMACVGIYLHHRAFFHSRAPFSNTAQQQTQSGIPPVRAQLATSSWEDDGFDKPLLKTVVDLGKSPYLLSGDSNHSTLTCLYFSTFVVKELDMKEKGDEWTAVAPSTPDHRPPCVQQHGRNEFEIKDADGHNWAGYFSGVKGNLVFLDGDDGYNEGMQFGVFDALTGKKIFEDSSEFLDKQHLNISNKDGALIIRYRRVDAADCSLPQKMGECWDQIRKKSGLKPQQMPQCNGYGHEGVDDTDPSVVSYPYEVTLLPELKKTQLQGEVKCWPAD
jgi:hypothetical protein